MDKSVLNVKQSRCKDVFPMLALFCYAKMTASTKIDKFLTIIQKGLEKSFRACYNTMDDNVNLSFL